MLSLDSWVKLNSQTVGKDKLARLIQYLSRFVWHSIERKKKLHDAISKLKIIESTLSTFRKCLRFGKSIEVFLGTLKTIHLNNPLIKMTTTLSRIYQALFLILDNLVFLQRVHLINWKESKLQEYANKFWLGSIILNCIRDMYEICLALQMKTWRNSSQFIPYNIQTCAPLLELYKTIPRCRPIMIFLDTHQEIFWDTLKNVCDVWIPLTSLGQVKLSPGVVGLLGTVSSFAGLVTVLYPTLKLSPS